MLAKNHILRIVIKISELFLLDHLLKLPAAY